MPKDENAIRNYAEFVKKICDDEVIAQIEQGKLTKEEVKELIGKPAHVGFLQNDMIKLAPEVGLEPTTKRLTAALIHSKCLTN